MLDSGPGRIAVGWLIVEDLAMVLALVLLPALAGVLGGDARGVAGQAGGGSLWLTLALTLAKVGLFLVLVLVVGQRVIPWILGQVARTGSRELFTLAVLATALGIAYGSAELFGVSFALGAFFAGVVLAESEFSHRAAADSLPLQDAFAVLFFVSVGMLFDPSILVREPLAVLAVLARDRGRQDRLRRSASCWRSATRMPTALTVSASLAQIGEFSFILAGLGVALGLLPQEGRDLILAGALLSIMAQPGGVRRYRPARALGWTRDRRLPRRRRAGLCRRPRADARTTPRDAERPRDHRRLRPRRPHRRRGSHGDLELPLGRDRAGPAARRGAARSRALPWSTAMPPPRVCSSMRAADRARYWCWRRPRASSTPRIIELARELNPGIDIAVRASSESEVAPLEHQGVGSRSWASARSPSA